MFSSNLSQDNKIICLGENVKFANLFKNKINYYKNIKFVETSDLINLKKQNSHNEVDFIFCVTTETPTRVVCFI